MYDTLRWHPRIPPILEMGRSKTNRANGAAVFHVKALPFIIDDNGDIISVAPYVAGQPVFTTSRLAFQFLMNFATRDLKYRGFRDDRLASFEYKQEANFLLYVRVLTADSQEYELLRRIIR